MPSPLDFAEKMINFVAEFRTGEKAQRTWIMAL